MTLPADAPKPSRARLLSRVPLPSLLTLVTACAGADDGAASTGSSSGPSTSASTSAATATTTDAATGTSPTTDASVGASDTATDGPRLDLPPPECGELTPCGVLCVDLQSDPNNCGACGISCVITNGEPACSAGICGLAGCAPGHGDCDGELANGCEQALGPGEECGAICKEGKAEACNLFDDNCDGACDEGAIAGCRVGVHRSNSPTQGHFYTTDLGEAESGDLTLEAANFFRLYAAATPGLVPFHRCLKGNGKRFYTQSANCEGGGQLESVLGHIAPAEACGSTPLYRLYKGDTGAHFYTVSAAERDAAVSMYGFAYESVAGHVWTAP